MPTSLKLKLLPRATLKGKVGTSFPSGITGLPPIDVNQSGNNVQLSIDIDALELQLRQEQIITLTDGTNVTLNAALGNTFYLAANGNRTILAPTNKPASPYAQKVTIMHEAVGGGRTLALTTGSAGAFRFGTFVTTLTSTAVGTIDYIGAIYNPFDDRWDVVSYSKGF